ncbi:MAG: glycoside hydrolase family 2 protein [Firmicutes bacterium]|nr:glycoside hydrolase family 2 protein [Bacillota bacterium]
MISLNNGWQFTEEWSEDFLLGKGQYEEVRIPHTNRMLPYHSIDSGSYQMVCGYRKTVNSPCDMEGKRAFLQFEGAAHIASVYVNGEEKLTHRCGYTAFRVEITDELRDGKADIAVKLDTTENPQVPPFGFVVDYLTYGGIYRPVWMDITDRTYVEDIFVQTPDLETALVSFELGGDKKGGSRKVSLLDMDGNTVCSTKTDEDRVVLKAEGVKPWSVDEPNLYLCRVELEEGSPKEVVFGFRTAVFRSDGFYLNGKKLFIRGLDRHQSYPYIGYAATDSLQIEDARILKEELACNAVRTSHYPQAQSFIDECDRLGLLVFTEIPGWQHIGDEAWKKQAVKNTEEMVLQYRNHPSVVLWGVRINESQDDDEFYKETNKVARELDPSRQTSGVRYIQKSSCLEDVYAFNDFSHSGKNAGVLPKKKVLRPEDMQKALLISECNGHMFPTKSFDKWEVRQEHALRHARTLNDAMADGEHAGLFAWCMYDYPTHKDFGSGDRICYHGVMDGFRNPKTAAALWSSQGDERDVLEVSSSMDIGDYPAGQIGIVYVFSNADEVRLYKNGQFVTTLGAKPYKALPHSPLAVDDVVGDLLKTNEGFTGGKEKLIHECLAAAKKYGINDMPLKYTLKLGWAMFRYGMKYSEGVALYGKYVGDWGGSATVWRFEGIKNGKVVSVKELSPNVDIHLDVRTSSYELSEGDIYDMAAVRVRVLNAYGNVQIYHQVPVFFEASGAVELAGPSASTLEGGMAGCYIKTKGVPGEGNLKISCEGCESVNIQFTVNVK